MNIEAPRQEQVFCFYRQALRVGDLPAFISDSVEVHQRTYDFKIHSGRESFGKFMSWASSAKVDVLVTRDNITDETDSRITSLTPLLLPYPAA